MVMWKRGTFILVLCVFIGLVGCDKKTDSEPPAKETEEVKQPEKTTVIEEPEPVEVKIIDPNTKAILKTFMPEETVLETDKEAFQTEVETWVKEMARGTETIRGYDQKMIQDRIGSKGEIIKGKPRIILKESELVEKVMEASSSGGEIELPIYVTESGYKPEEAAQLDDVVLSSFTTYFNSGVVGRSKNIELSANALNNIIVGNGDIFSFNTMVGPGTAENGYQPAKEIVDKKMVMGIGGGICQTSSTLFNAIDQLGVQYVEWHNHSLSIGYVPVGRDATVAYGVKDFRFQNTTGAPLLIKTIYNKGKLTIEIRSTAAYKGLIAKG